MLHWSWSSSSMVEVDAEDSGESGLGDGLSNLRRLAGGLSWWSSMNHL